MQEKNVCIHLGRFVSEIFEDMMNSTHYSIWPFATILVLIPWLMLLQQVFSEDSENNKHNAGRTCFRLALFPSWYNCDEFGSLLIKNWLNQLKSGMSVEFPLQEKNDCQHWRILIEVFTPLQAVHNAIAEESSSGGSSHQRQLCLVFLDYCPWE